MTEINMDFQMKLVDDHSVVVRYSGGQANVVIPDTYAGCPVTEIAAGAFADNQKLETVLFPDTIISIGDEAFKGCKHLYYCGQKTRAVLPLAFSMLPRGLNYIGKHCFERTSIGELVSYGKALEIDDYAFAFCRELKKVFLRECKKLSLGKSVFIYSKLSTLEAPFVDLLQYSKECFGNCPAVEGKCAVSPKQPDEDVSLMDDCLPLLDGLFGDETLFEDMEMLNLDLPLFKDADESVEEEELIPFSDRILFSLQSIDDLNTMVAATSVTGRMKYFGIETHFVADFPKGARTPSLAFDGTQNPPKAVWLVEYLCKSKLKVTLTGKWSGKNFYVSHIKLVKDSIGTANMREDFFECFLCGTLNNGAEEKPMTQKELEAYFELSKEMLPKWVFQAYQKNAAIASGNYSSGNSSDERKHASRALELLASIDWTPHEVCIPPAREVRAKLDAEFYGLVAVKDRISEIVSQIKRSKCYPKWGLLLYGPAGVGKTTIAKATADALRLPLIQINVPSLGKDADTLVGSSRIYGNARPGMLLNSMLGVRSSSAVLLVNELDKLSGQDASCVDALLSILDKTGLYEHFLEETIPTNNLFCIATCNDLNKISGPMKDRFQIIEIGGYTMSEKSSIWDQYVFPAAIRRGGVEPGKVSLTKDAVDVLVHEYAFAPGARDLEQYAERIIGNFCLESEENASLQIQYSADSIRQLLGSGHCRKHYICNLPGVVNAAFYHNGTAFFFAVEASVRKGSGKFEVLGALPKIQEEYAKIAYLCACSDTNIDSSKVDTTIFIPQMLPDGPQNHVGLACYIAICCKLLSIQLPMNDLVFLGGCDLNGSLYFDETTLDPMLRSMNERGVKTLYAPVGCAFDLRGRPDYNLEVIEAPDAQSLFALALARSKQ